MKIIKNGTVYVAVSSFEEKDILKAAGFRWSPDARRWWTDNTVNVAKLIGIPNVEMEPQLQATVSKAKEAYINKIDASQATDADIEIPAPAGLSYMPFQRAGIQALLDRPKALLADEMGLGKTIQVCGIINYDPDLNSILVIVPAHLKLNWRDELTKWVSPVRRLTVGVLNGKIGRDDPTDCDIVVTNYDVLRKHAGFLLSRKWDLVAVDESHYAKNDKAARTKQVMALTEKAVKRAIWMTGSPNPNGQARELWTTVQALDENGLGQKFTRFHYRYTNVETHEIGSGWKRKKVTSFDGTANEEELNRRLRESIMIRRFKEDVLTELPPKIRKVVPVEVKLSKQARDIERTLAGLDENADEQQFVDTIKQLEAVKVDFEQASAYRVELGIAKAAQSASYITGLLEGGEKKIIVAIWHKAVANALMEALSDYNPVKMVGGMSADARRAAESAFQTDPTVRVAICNIAAAGTGLTLTAARTVVFAEMDWMPDINRQMEDRAHRISQNEQVYIQYIVADGSIEARIAQLNVEKAENIDKTVGKVADPTTLHRQDEVERAAEEAQEAVKAKRQRDEQRTRMAVQRRKEREMEFTPRQYQGLVKAVRYLTSIDADRALYRNSAGWNAADGGFGHSLAEQDSWTLEQTQAAFRMVRKYKVQLGNELYASIYGQGALV